MALKGCVHEDSYHRHMESTGIRSMRAWGSPETRGCSAPCCPLRHDGLMLLAESRNAWNLCCSVRGVVSQ